MNKRFRRDEVITFSKLNVVYVIIPYLDALVIKILIGNKVRRVYVNNGVVINIIYKNWKFSIDKTHLKPCMSLQTFT